jgi:hypothetical protein
MQVLPLLALLTTRRRSREIGVAVTHVAGVSYFVLFVLLIVQALRGEALVAPGGVSLALLAAWTLGTAAFARLALRSDTASGPLMPRI